MAKILALGGAGFIGSYIVRKLLENEHQVTVVDNFSKYGYIEHDFYQNPNFSLCNKDVRNMYPQEFRGYDYVFCLAALIGGIKYFHRIPYQIARDNTEILSQAIDNTLAACPEATFVYFSSSMVFERVDHPVSEEHALQQQIPITNYGMQKLFGEFLTTGAHREYDLRYLIVRPFNAVGSGELPDVSGDGEAKFGMAHVIPDFIYKAMLKQTPFEIFGEGDQVRTFTHAKDIANAVAKMIDKKVVNRDFNLCGENTFTMLELAKRIWAHVNPETAFPELKHIPAPPSDVKFRVGIAKRAMQELDWQPQCDIDYIIKDSTDYIRKNCPVS
ncbi:NAD-dependent epimerase/dehydratase family protein [Candidatus Uabimicrobium amorphum]|uniref:NAD-dependent epimerase n=1 Tax=Uabimicrobium amorphum TaxID=2596890 RepID=A0A5S9F4C5_UABAM|nr:NAD-dependent epimerase/dehydratase family protein [Candidatus Uabimicrobium amorphum]BBM85657.1 NAD-dependent epimerase [Candidatus Uabimicrobium amorphum]